MKILQNIYDKIHGNVTNESDEASTNPTASPIGNTPLNGSQTISQRKEKKALIQIPETTLRNWQVLEDQPYYLGYVSRETAEEFLKNSPHGTFLVRRVAAGNSMEHVVSAKYNYGADSMTYHLLVRQTRKKRLYWLDTYAFKTIIEMIQFHIVQRVPIRVFDDCGADIMIYEKSFDRLLKLRKEMLVQRLCKFVELKNSVEKPVTQIYHEQFHLMKEIGSGAFGEVYLGYLERSFFRSRVPVAIKKLLDRGMTHEQRLNLLREADVMKKFDHINVVKFYGIAAAKDPIMIAMELCEGKSLEKKVSEEVTTVDEKLHYLYGAAKGLKYIHEQKTIHRDIAARNCLLDKNNNVKISDFGLSLVDQNAIGKHERLCGQLPIRYMAPETNLHGIYSFASDVYSFGAMMYEVFHKAVEVFGELQGDSKVLRKAFAYNHTQLYLWDRPTNVMALDPKTRKMPTLADKKKRKRRAHKNEKDLGEIDSKGRPLIASTLTPKEVKCIELIPNFDTKMEKPQEENVVESLQNLFNKCRKYCPEDRIRFIDGHSESVSDVLLEMIRYRGGTINEEKPRALKSAMEKLKKIKWKELLCKEEVVDS